MESYFDYTISNEAFFDGLKASLPPVFTRKVASEMTGQYVDCLILIRQGRDHQ